MISQAQTRQVQHPTMQDLHVPASHSSPQKALYRMPGVIVQSKAALGINQQLPSVSLHGFGMPRPPRWYATGQ